MAPFSLPLTQIINENLSVVMAFALSRAPLAKVINTRFVEDWKHLAKPLFAIPEQHATKACIELALFLRLLDDKEGISGFLKENSERHFGRLVGINKSESLLGLRDVANKIIHASDLTWDFAELMSPKLVCASDGENGWIRAEIDIVSVAAICGLLID